MEYPNLLFKFSSFVLTALLLIFTNTLSAQEDATVETEEPATETVVDLAGDPAAGRQLFNSNCAACHQLDRKAIGPALRGMAQRYEKEWLYSWIRNSQALVQAGDPIAVALFNEYNGSVMQAFPQLTDKDLDDLVAYTSQPKAEPVAATTDGGPTTSGSEGGISNTLVLGLLIVVMLMLVIMLFMVSNVLKKNSPGK